LLFYLLRSLYFRKKQLNRDPKKRDLRVVLDAAINWLGTALHFWTFQYQIPRIVDCSIVLKSLKKFFLQFLRLVWCWPVIEFDSETHFWSTNSLFEVKFCFQLHRWDLQKEWRNSQRCVEDLRRSLLPWHSQLSQWGNCQCQQLCYSGTKLLECYNQI